jgi:hypothetical protein
MKRIALNRQVADFLYGKTGEWVKTQCHECRPLAQQTYYMLEPFRHGKVKADILTNLMSEETIIDILFPQGCELHILEDHKPINLIFTDPKCMVRVERKGDEMQYSEIEWTTDTSKGEVIG